MAEVSAEELLDQLQFAQIATAYVEDDQGLHIQMIDGRILVISGHFAIAVLKSDKLH
jgi:hypothetical protein